jgi:hypothetical protein
MVPICNSLPFCKRPGTRGLDFALWRLDTRRQFWPAALDFSHSDAIAAMKIANTAMNEIE